MSSSLFPDPDQAQANTDKPARSWWGVNEIKPFEVHLNLPWRNRHRPYVALHVSQWGHEGGPKGWRRIIHVVIDEKVLGSW